MQFLLRHSWDIQLSQYFYGGGYIMNLCDFAKKFFAVVGSKTYNFFSQGGVLPFYISKYFAEGGGGFQNFKLFF